MTRLYHTEDFRNYTAAAAAIRRKERLDRLSPKRAAEVRAAVARHRERADRKKAEAQAIAAREAAKIAPTASALPSLGSIYRLGPAVSVKVSLDTEPKVEISSDRKWISGRRGYGWVTESSEVALAVSPNYVRGVRDRGLALLDGLLTTHAWLAKVEGEVEIYRAAWLRQGQGYSLKVERGAIAIDRATNTAYHAETPKKALSGLRRKLKLQGLSPAERESRSEAARLRAEARAESRRRKLESLVERLRRFDLGEIGGVVVSQQDSIRAGNCRPGTEEFAERFFGGRESATIAEIGAAVGPNFTDNLSGANLELARQIAAACLRAIRRDRNASRALAV